ncbi:MAG: hypothetical protein HC895_19740 [Leptolyngbyaceae cyanobacterium SM1_3_5]|nr:hypothetical protein [Leptolyngbyaceae cyanobacterium SM1_3_5]
MPPQNASTVSIALQSFFDFELDLYGWYALGHHDPANFLNAVAARDPKAGFLPQNVQQGWAAFRESGFDFVTRSRSAPGTVSLPGFHPITVIAWSGNGIIDA